MLPIIISGVILGSVYALMSMGLTVIWGGLRMLNLTQGALFMFGAYTALVIGHLGLPPIAGIAGAFVVIGCLGLLIYAGPLRMLLSRPDRENATLLATIGLATVLENIALRVFGARSQVVPALSDAPLKLGDVVLTWNAIIMTAVAIGLLIVMGVVLKWSRFGIAVRALAQDRDGARLSGINMNATYATVVFVSSGLAGIGGVLLSSYYFVSPFIGGNYLLIALIVTILGGLGSIAGTLYAAYLVGIIQAVTSFFLGVRWSLPVLFTLIIAILIIRPSGLAGESLQERL